MRKFFLEKSKYKVNDLHLSLTRKYFDFLKIVAVEHKDMYDELNFSLEECMDLYRHCLCLCLGLDSTPAYKEFEPLYVKCCEYLNTILEPMIFVSDSAKSGVLEACMHCIVMTSNKMRG